MKNLITTSILLLLFQVGFAQTFSFSVGAEYPMFPAYSFKDTNDYTIRVIEITDMLDTIVVQSDLRNIHGYKIAYYSDFALRANVEVLWNLKKSFAIESGIGFRYNRFFPFNEGDGTQSQILQQDTLEFEPYTGTSTGYSCDFFHTEGDINSFEPSYTVVEVNLPIKLAYSVWDGDIKFYLGGTIASSIFVSQHRGTYSDRDEMISGSYHCTSIYGSEKVNAIDAFTRLNIGATFGFEYWPYRRLGFQINTEKRFTNLFKQVDSFRPQISPFLITNNSTTPTYIGVSLKYGFNR